jgi:large subunit ribosomal protein L19
MMMDTLIKFEPNANIPALSSGDTVKVSIKIVEGERVRNQMFQGVVIKVKKGGSNASFTVRRVAYGVGVERTFFFTSPSVDKVEVLRHGKVRRAKLYYLRGLTAKKARIAEKRPKEAQAEHAEQ